MNYPPSLHSPPHLTSLQPLPNQALSAANLTATSIGSGELSISGELPTPPLPPLTPPHLTPLQTLPTYSGSRCQPLMEPHDAPPHLGTEARWLQGLHWHIPRLGTGPIPSLGGAESQHRASVRAPSLGTDQGLGTEPVPRLGCSAVQRGGEKQSKRASKLHAFAHSWVAARESQRRTMAAACLVTQAPGALVVARAQAACARWRGHGTHGIALQ